MKLSVNTKDMTKGLRTLQRLESRSRFDNASSDFFSVEASATRLRLGFQNDGATISVDVPADIQEPGRIQTVAKGLLKIVPNAEKGVRRIFVTGNTDDRLFLQSGKAEFALVSAPPDPALLTPECGKLLCSGKLADALKAVLFAHGKGWEFQHMSLQLCAADGNEVVAYAADGYIAAEARVEADVREAFTLPLPGHHAKLVASVLKGETVSLWLSETHAVFYSAEARITLTRDRWLELPSMKRAFAEALEADTRTFAVLDRRACVKALKNPLLGDNVRVWLFPDTQTAAIAGEMAEEGATRVPLPVRELSGANVEIKCARASLYKIIREMTGQTLEMTIRAERWIVFKGGHLTALMKSKQGQERR